MSAEPRKKYQSCDIYREFLRLGQVAFSAIEYRLLGFIIMRTVPFGHVTEKISYRQIIHGVISDGTDTVVTGGTRLSFDSVVRAVGLLVEKSVITVGNPASFSNARMLITLNVDELMRRLEMQTVANSCEGKLKVSKNYKKSAPKSEHPAPKSEHKRSKIGAPCSKIGAPSKEEYLKEDYKEQESKEQESSSLTVGEVFGSRGKLKEPKQKLRPYPTGEAPEPFGLYEPPGSYDSGESNFAPTRIRRRRRDPELTTTGVEDGGRAAWPRAVSRGSVIAITRTPYKGAGPGVGRVLATTPSAERYRPSQAVSEGSQGGPDEDDARLPHVAVIGAIDAVKERSRQAREARKPTLAGPLTKYRFRTLWNDTLAELAEERGPRPDGVVTDYEAGMFVRSKVRDPLFQSSDGWQSYIRDVLVNWEDYMEEFTGTWKRVEGIPADISFTFFLRHPSPFLRYYDDRENGNAAHVERMRARSHANEKNLRIRVESLQDTIQSLEKQLAVATRGYDGIAHVSPARIRSLLDSESRRLARLNKMNEQMKTLGLTPPQWSRFQDYLENGIDNYGILLSEMYHPTVAKLIRGEELTPEEDALLRKAYERAA